MGFNLHAAVAIRADDKAGKQRLCRYVSRPPLAQQALTLLPSGDVCLRLKKPWSDGTTAFTFSPMDFLSRLVGLVFPPRMHKVRFHGIWAPHAKLRSKAAKPAEKPPGCEAHRPKWAELMRQVFGDDVFACPNCPPGTKQTVVLVIRAQSIAQILTSVGLPADSPA